MALGRRMRGAAGIAVLAVGLSASVPSAASAQGLLDALFGGFGGQRPARSLPPQASSFANPFEFERGERRASSG